MKGERFQCKLLLTQALYNEYTISDNNTLPWNHIIKNHPYKL